MRHPHEVIPPGDFGRCDQTRRGRLTTCKAREVERAPEPVEHISAITLLTTDMERAVEFYEELGFALLYGGGQAPFTSFRVGRSYLNLQVHPGRTGRTAVWGRVVFWVDDVDRMHERVMEAGFLPETTPADAPWGERYFHVRDPDGHELSFARPLSST